MRIIFFIFLLLCRFTTVDNQLLSYSKPFLIDNSTIKISKDVINGNQGLVRYTGAVDTSVGLITARRLNQATSEIYQDHDFCKPAHGVVNMLRYTTKIGTSTQFTC